MGCFEYGKYSGSIETDMDRKILWGKILFINDLVTYEAIDLLTLEKEFRLAVDDYVATCKEIGKEPQKPLKGVFQVRVSPENHKAALLRSRRDNTTLNDVISKALSAYLVSDVVHKHQHTHQVIVTPQGSHEQKIFSVGPGPAQRWSKH